MWPFQCFPVSVLSKFCFWPLSPPSDFVPLFASLVFRFGLIKWTLILPDSWLYPYSNFWVLSLIVHCNQTLPRRMQLELARSKARVPEDVGQHTATSRAKHHNNRHRQVQRPQAKTPTKRGLLSPIRNIWTPTEKTRVHPECSCPAPAWPPRLNCFVKNTEESYSENCILVLF